MSRNTLNKKNNMTQLVLLRHGQSIWNRDKIFTGWSDVALSPKGRQEAKQAGQMMMEAGLAFDLCFSSELERSTDTLKILLSEMAHKNLSTQQHWRLNERHYGALEGITRWQAVKKFGIWPVLRPQLNFKGTPPLLNAEDERYPGNQSRYASINQKDLPLAESMHQTHLRTKVYWKKVILPEIQNGKRVLIVSHKNVLRTIIMQLEHLSHTQIMNLSLATGKPLVYELDDTLKSIRHYYVGQSK
jgi:2,3-bisphosphoglycerate-dependent phosphoglycerate mutase